ncbi:ribosomal protein L7/L12 [Patescibacteria group bacterium]|nr:ribosomal protein L7/L12 [Patescibacteria group bacterium]
MTAKEEIKEQKNGKTEKQVSSKSAKSAGSKTVDKLVNEIAKLSVIELSELVNSLKDKLGVEAAPVAATVSPGQTAAEEAAPAQGAGGGAATQTVTMTAAGDKKIEVIKALRLINQNLGLKEAKDMTESLPAEILKDVKADEAKEAAEKLKVAGAQVELK